MTELMRIVERRREKLSKSELRRRLGFGPGEWSRYNRGLREMTRPTMARVVRVLEDAGLPLGDDELRAWILDGSA